MTPMTPFVESPTGRLTELVYLLSDRPLALAHQSVLDAEAETAPDFGKSDPWLVVASALQGLSNMTEATLWSRYQQQVPARSPKSEWQLVVT